FGPSARVGVLARVVSWFMAASSCPRGVSVYVDAPGVRKGCRFSGKFFRGSRALRRNEKRPPRGGLLLHAAITQMLISNLLPCASGSSVDQLMVLVWRRMYCFHASEPDSRPPPVSFSPPNAPPISAPLVPMLTLAMPQSEPA